MTQTGIDCAVTRGSVTRAYASAYASEPAYALRTHACASRTPTRTTSHYFCTLTPYKMDVAFVACYITGLAHGGHVLIYINGRLPRTTRRCVILNFQNKNSPKSMPRSFRTGKWPLTLQMRAYRPYWLNSMLFECYFSETEIFFCSCYQEESE